MTGTEYATAVSPWQTEAVPVIVPAATGRGLTVTVALPDMVVVPPTFVPSTVYVPATVWLPKEIAFPVPSTEGVSSALFLINVYVTPTSESERPTATPVPPSQYDPPPVTVKAVGGGGFN
jgi:hypothetical protein